MPEFLMGSHQGVMALEKLEFFVGLVTCLILVQFSSIEAPYADPVPDYESHLVTSLPGFAGDFPSKHYSGYVEIDDKKNLFYYFVVSERDPVTDPVVLWLNGGPGCSSFDGFIYEHGPFNFREGTEMPTLELNPYSWSKASNIIYLDSPVGVGFSYSRGVSKYKTGDLQTAADSHLFLLKWFDLHPAFLNNSFYIAGESYAGIYVPTLVEEVVQGIKAGRKPVIKLKGYMVGNGVTDPLFDGNALVSFVHGMAIISNRIYDDVLKNCGGHNYYPTDSELCDFYLKKVDKALRNLNIYDTLAPCYHQPYENVDNTNGDTTLPPSFRKLGVTPRPLPVRRRMFGRAWPFWSSVNGGNVTLWPQLDATAHHVECTNDDVAIRYLNDPDVREAIHARPHHEIGAWELCVGWKKIDYHWNDAGSMIPYHIRHINRGLRVLIYSGDHDLCVPFTGSEAWTSSLNYPIVDEWREWMVGDQVAGYLEEYEKNFTFLTVMGSGHTVPEYKPKEALYFYNQWLQHLKI